MKKISIITIALIVLTANARIIEKFPGWDKLKADSAYIALVCCGNSISEKTNLVVEDGPKSDSEIQILYTLKGTNHVSSPQLLTDHELSSGNKYLVFGYFDHDDYYAFARFRVIPLYTYITSNSIARLPFDEQINYLLKIGLEKSNHQVAFDLDEQQRLEDAFKK